jgi:hypothetical protein
MRRIVGTTFVFALLAFPSCSGSGDDSVVRACRVIVETCQRFTSVGGCLDEIGSLSTDCLDCVSTHGCEYATCQSDVPACRLPGFMLDPKDRIDPGPRPADAGTTDVGSPDTGSNG